MWSLTMTETVKQSWYFDADFIHQLPIVISKYIAAHLPGEIIGMKSNLHI